MVSNLILRNKVAVITGASGGIGAAIVERFLKEGAIIVVADIERNGLNKNIGCTFFKVDISKPVSVKRFLRSVILKYGRIDILVNVAAIQTPIGSLLEVSVEDWIKCINTNLIGTMLCCKLVLPIMTAKRKGKIINFSGGGATFARPYFSAYASSKAAIVRFTETIAMECSRNNIDINAVSPGTINTRMMNDIIQAGKKKGSNDYEIALKVKSRGGDSVDLTTDLCVFLASPKSDGISGKLFSAKWDDWKAFSKTKYLKNSSIYTLRRIDGVKFIERK